MSAHQDRVLQEKADLSEKIVKLTAFMVTEVFHQLPEEDRKLLREQWELMMKYEWVLAQRIKRFA